MPEFEHFPIRELNKANDENSEKNLCMLIRSLRHVSGKPRTSRQSGTYAICYYGCNGQKIIPIIPTYTYFVRLDPLNTGLK